MTLGLRCIAVASALLRLPCRHPRFTMTTAIGTIGRGPDSPSGGASSSSSPPPLRAPSPDQRHREDGSAAVSSDGARSNKRPRPPPLTERVYLAPMVRGSELASRMLARSHYGPDFLCYSPMLRAKEVVDAYESVWKGRFCSDAAAVLALTAEDKAALRTEMREDAYLTVLDTCPFDAPLVVQLCGQSPKELAAATSALLNVHDALGNPLAGVDLNLGCPQVCASEGGFGAFLAEGDPELAVECLQAMREAIDAYAESARRAVDGTGGGRNGKPPRLSTKIRLKNTVADTISFATRLRDDAGCDLLAVHCRRREDKHDGAPDYDAGAAIVQALQENKPEANVDNAVTEVPRSIPVVINGDVKSQDDARRVLERTGAHAVMVARGFLVNSRLLLEPPPQVRSDNGNGNDGNVAAMTSLDPAFLAAEYLTFVEQYPPPTALYVRKHLLWIFRKELQPDRPDVKSGQQIDYTDWRPRLWTFLRRPYLETVEQFRGVVGLYIKLSGSTRMPPSLEGMEEPSFKSIRHGKLKKKNLK